MANVIKTVLSIFYEFMSEARVFCPGKFLEPSLIFAGKVEAYLSETLFRNSTLALSLTHKHSSLLRKFVNYVRKKFTTLGPGVNVNLSLLSTIKGFQKSCR